MPGDPGIPQAVQTDVSVAANIQQEERHGKIVAHGQGHGDRDQGIAGQGQFAQRDPVEGQGVVIAEPAISPPLDVEFGRSPEGPIPPQQPPSDGQGVGRAKLRAAKAPKPKKTTSFLRLKTTASKARNKGIVPTKTVNSP